MEEMKTRELTQEEIEMLDRMSTKEALKYLGCEELEQPETVEEIKASLSPWGRQVVDFLVENYPIHIRTLRLTGQLRTIAEQRDEEATEMALKIEKEYMKEHHSEDYLTNLGYHYEAAAIAREIVNREVLFRKLW